MDVNRGTNTSSCKHNTPTTHTHTHTHKRIVDRNECITACYRMHNLWRGTGEKRGNLLQGDPKWLFELHEEQAAETKWWLNFLSELLRKLQRRR